MKKSKLKEILKPIVKECIKEAILEEGVLSGVITEVAQGLRGIPKLETVQAMQPTTKPESHVVNEAKKQLSEIKNDLRNATGLKGIFEGTEPLSNAGVPGSSHASSNNKYSPLANKDPGDPGVNIDGLMKYINRGK